MKVPFLPQYMFNNISNFDIIDHWVLPCYAQAPFDLTSSYLVSINFQFFFCRKTRIWCHIW